MHIRLRNFSGIAPLLGTHNLPDNMAQVAINARLRGGELQAWDNRLKVIALEQAGVLRTIYKFSSTIWFAWDASVDVVKGPVSGDTTNRTYFTGTTGGPRVTNETLAVAGAGGYPRTSYKLGVPAPTTAPTVTPGAGGSGDNRYTAWKYSFVNGFGEEGPFSPATDPTDCMSGQTMTLSSFESSPDADYNLTAIRIYRVLSGEDGADYQYVDEIDIDTASYDDSTEDIDLGEIQVTADFLPPDDNLIGLISLPNGVFGGFVGKDLYFSEPYYVYAWPTDYNLTLPFPIVALGYVGQTIVVATEAYPYILVGQDPATYSQTKLTDPAPCSSKRSLVYGNSGVMWATPDGIYRTTGGDGEIITRTIIDKYDWQENFYPSTIRGHIYGNKYLGFFESGSEGGYPTGGGFVLDYMKNPPELTMLDFFYSASTVDVESGKLYAVGRIEPEALLDDEGEALLDDAGEELLDG